MTDARSRTLLIMAGGTGGHVYPALAVARIMLERGWSVEWLGTREGIEARVVPANGIALHAMSAVGLRGKSWRKLLVAPFHLLRAAVQAFSAFRKVRPDVVLGMGGFVSGPGGLCALLLRVPLLVHEQNAIAGTANRLLARMASRVLSAFPDVLPGSMLVGNPVRQDIAVLASQPGKQMLRDRPVRLLVLGGSLGAQALNKVVPEALALLPESMRPEVFHQTGNALYDDACTRYATLGVKAQIEPFVEDMASRYQWADLAVCRAGAMTVSELACAQLPALLVPFPYAIDDHQTANARWLADAGGARVLPQSTLTAELLATELRRCLEQPEVLERMSQCSLQKALPEAARTVADICEQASGLGNSQHVQK